MAKKKVVNKMVVAKLYSMNAFELIGTDSVFNKDVINAVKTRNQDDFNSAVDVFKKIYEQKMIDEKQLVTEEDYRKLKEYINSIYIVDNFKVIDSSDYSPFATDIEQQ